MQKENKQKYKETFYNNLNNVTRNVPKVTSII